VSLLTAALLVVLAVLVVSYLAVTFNGAMDRRDARRRNHR
jgi:hypothetical protein